MPAIPVQRFFALFLLIGGICATPMAVRADDSVYQVNGVGVDVTAGNEVEAKSLGLARAKQQAFQDLIERLTLSEARASIPSIDNAALEQMIYGVSIPSEKMSRGQGRYLARVNVSFLPDAVRDWLQSNHIAYVETRSKKLVILPVMRDGTVDRLWQDGNVWLRAWGQLVLETGLVPVTLPLGDLSDIATVSAPQALAGDPERMQAIAQKYGADGVLLTVAQADMTAQGQLQNLSVTSRVIADGWPDAAYNHSAQGAADQDPMATMGRTAKQVLTAVEQDWKRRNLIDYSAGHQMMVVTAPLQSLNDWVHLRQALDRLAVVDRYVVETLSTTEAVVALDYVGTTEQLQTGLAQADMTLRYDDLEQRWLLSRQ